MSKSCLTNKKNTVHRSLETTYSFETPKTRLILPFAFCWRHSATKPYQTRPRGIGGSGGEDCDWRVAEDESVDIVGQ